MIMEPGVGGYYCPGIFFLSFFLKLKRAHCLGGEHSVCLTWTGKLLGLGWHKESPAGRLDTTRLIHCAKDMLQMSIRPERAWHACILHFVRWLVYLRSKNLAGSSDLRQRGKQKKSVRSSAYAEQTYLQTPSRTTAIQTPINLLFWPFLLSRLIRNNSAD